LKVLKNIFQEYLDEIEANKMCKKGGSSILLPKINGIKKQEKTRSRKNWTEHGFERMSFSVPTYNSKYAAFTSTNNTREAKQITSSNVLARRNISQTQNINLADITRNIGIQWSDKSYEVINLREWETKLIERFPFMKTSNQELTFSEEESVSHFLRCVLKEHKTYVTVTSPIAGELKRIREKLANSGSFLKCDQFPSRLVIVPVTEDTCQIFENLDTSERSLLIAMYLRPRQRLQMTGTNNSI
jgi:hypothetical protein